MKKSLFNAYLIIFLHFTIDTPITAHGMEPIPGYIHYFQASHGANYGINNSLINMEHTMRTIGLVTYYGATHAKDALHKPIELIHEQLKAFKTQLLQEEHNLLIAIKNKYHVSDEIWQRCMTDIQEIKAIYKDSMKHIWPGIIHDTNIPATLLETIKSMLTKNGINPGSINIVMVTDKEEIKNNPHTNAQASEWINSFQNKYDNSFGITKRYIPSSIEIYPRMENAALERQISVAAHEVQHLIQQHNLTKMIITKYLNHYHNIADKTFFACDEYDKLVQNHEEQAEILSAIADPEVATALKNYRFNTFYPGYLYEEHYYRLATIDRLWKLNYWLTYLYQNNISSDIVAKVHCFAQSCKQVFASN